MNSGAVVVAVSRNAWHRTEIELWEEGRELLRRAHERIPSYQLKVVILHFASGGPPPPPNEPRPQFSPVFDPDVPPPDFVDVVRVRREQFVASVPSPRSREGPLPGWVPRQDAYISLIDDRTAGSPATDASFAGKFGHLPSMLFLAADTQLVNKFDRMRASRPTGGLLALGLSNDTLKQVVVPVGLELSFSAADHQLFRNNWLIRAIRFIRTTYGVTTEQTDFAPGGWLPPSDPPIGGADPGADLPLAEPVSETIYHALARQLDRVRRLLDLGVLS